MAAAARKLTIEFSTEDAFRSEYASNIAKGGVFIATRDPLPMREAVRVEIRLAWCGHASILDGEIVHVIPAEMERAGATPGAAVQLFATPSELRREFEPFAGATEGNERVAQSGRRSAPRFVARVAIRARSSCGAVVEGRSRDVSSSGLLLALEGEATPVGERLELEIEHPQSGERMRIAGTVVRHLRCEDGEVSALGVEFQAPEARQSEVAAFMSDVRAAEHSRRLGSISGPVAELGIATLLQMFGASAPRGTLIVTRGAEEGFILFESGVLLAARLGRRSGMPALERMLGWRDGQFEFHVRVDELERREGERIPLNAAILDVLRQLDEGARPPETSGGGIDLGAGEGDDLEFEIDPEPAQEGPLPADASFTVDPARADHLARELSKTERAILDLAAVGMSFARIAAVIPEPETEVEAAIRSLLDQGVMGRRAGA